MYMRLKELKLYLIYSIYNRTKKVGCFGVNPPLTGVLTYTKRKVTVFVIVINSQYHL